MRKALKDYLFVFHAIRPPSSLQCSPFLRPFDLRCLSWCVVLLVFLCVIECSMSIRLLYSLKPHLQVVVEILVVVLVWGGKKSEGRWRHQMIVYCFSFSLLNVVCHLSKSNHTQVGRRSSRRAVFQCYFFCYSVSSFSVNWEPVVDRSGEREGRGWGRGYERRGANEIKIRLFAVHFAKIELSEETCHLSSFSLPFSLFVVLSDQMEDEGSF